MAEFDPLRQGITGRQAYFLCARHRQRSGTHGRVVQGKASMRIPMSELPLSLDERLFSNRVDLSEAGFAAESLDHPWAHFPYVVTSKTGTQPDSGLMDQAGTGSRFFSRKTTDVQVWVGTTGWDAAEETLPDNGDEEETV
jgi:type VI secretion system secreted protein VgrG